MTRFPLPQLYACTKIEEVYFKSEDQVLASYFSMAVKLSHTFLIWVVWWFVCLFVFSVSCYISPFEIDTVIQIVCNRKGSKLTKS